MAHKDRGAKIFTFVFLVAVFGFSAANLKYSFHEVREDVAELDFSWSEMKGSFQAVETSLSEEMLFRYPLIEAYGILQMAMGKQEENAFSNVRDKDGFLYSGNFWSTFGDDTKELAARTRRLQDQLKEKGTAFGFVALPMKVPAEQEKYAGIPYSDRKHRTDTFCAWARYYGVPVLDLRENWKEAGLSYEEAFFKTDHHWTPQAAFAAYGSILHWLQDVHGAQIYRIEQLCDPAQYEYETKKNAMLGSNGRDTGLLYAGGPEDYTAIYPKEEGSYLLRTGKYEDFAQYEGGFQEALLELDFTINDYEDYYDGDAEAIYLHGGVSDYTSIQNKNAPSEEKILLLRDSYSTPIGAFLAQSFAQVDLLWTREWTEEELALFLEENTYDYVLVALYAENLQQAFFPFGAKEDGEEDEAQ